MTLRDDLKKAAAVRPMDNALEQLNDWFFAATEKFAAGIPKFLKEVEGGYADGKLLENEVQMSCDRITADQYVAALPRIEALPGYRKFQEFCADPARDTGYSFSLSDSTYRIGGSPCMKFGIRIRPTLSYDQSEVCVNRWGTGTVTRPAVQKQPPVPRLSP